MIGLPLAVLIGGLLVVLKLCCAVENVSYDVENGKHAARASRDYGCLRTG